MKPKEVKTIVGNMEALFRYHYWMSFHKMKNQLEELMAKKAKAKKPAKKKSKKAKKK